jgi:putative membrane protein
MYWLWWLFWIAIVVLFFGFARPVPRRRWRRFGDETPLGRLQRRYAAGELTTQEYEERRAILERDREAAAPPLGSDRTIPQAP